MADPAIPLSYQPPKFQSGSDLLQRGLSIQSLAQNTQINAARLKEEQMRVKTAEEDREDAGIIQQAFGDPKYKVADPAHPGTQKFDDVAFRNDIAPKVRLRNLQKWDSDHATAVRSLHESVMTDLAINDKKLDAANKLNEIKGKIGAKLSALSNEDKAAAYPGFLKQLADAGDPNVASYPQTIPSDGSFNPTLQNWVTGTAYERTVYNDLQKKQQAARQEQQARAIEQKTAEDLKQHSREEAARTYLKVKTPEAHQKWLDSLDPSIAAEYKDIPFDPKSTPQVINDMALSTQQRTVAGQRDQTEQDRVQNQKDVAQARIQAEKDRTQYQREVLDLRRDLGEQNIALRRDLAANGGARKLTGNAFHVEERSIAALEDGTAARPGLNSQRLEYGKLLTPRKDAKGNPIYDKVDSKGKPIYDSDGALTAAGDAIKSKLDAATDTLQKTQYRKAALYGFRPPDSSDVEAAKDGEEINATDGTVWQKKGGVAFFKRKDTAPADEPAAPAEPASPKAPAAASPAPTTAPAKAPVAANTGGQPEERITVKLPDGKHVTGPKSQIDKFMADQGYAYNK